MLFEKGIDGKMGGKVKQGLNFSSADYFLIILRVE